VGNSITLADVIIYDMFTGFLGEQVDAGSASFPELKEHVNKIGSIDKIKNYHASGK